MQWASPKWEQARKPQASWRSWVDQAPCSLGCDVPRPLPSGTPSHCAQDIGFRRREFGGPMRREGLLGEAVQMGNVRRANDMVAQAGAEILRVHEGLPTLPYVEPALVKSCTAGIFLDVLVGNLMSEMLIQQRIRANLGQVEKMAGQVQQCMQWTRANGQAFSQRSLQAEAAASGKAAELRALRLRLLDAL